MHKNEGNSWIMKSPITRKFVQYPSIEYDQMFSGGQIHNKKLKSKKNKNQSNISKIQFLAQNTKLQITRTRTEAGEKPPSSCILALLSTSFLGNFKRWGICLMDFLSNLIRLFLKLLLATKASWNVTRQQAQDSQQPDSQTENTSFRIKQSLEILSF